MCIDARLCSWCFMRLARRKKQGVGLVVEAAVVRSRTALVAEDGGEVVVGGVRARGGGFTAERSMHVACMTACGVVGHLQFFGHNLTGTPLSTYPLSGHWVHGAVCLFVAIIVLLAIVCRC